MRLPLPVLLTLLVAAFAVLMGLGIWQLQRNEWKQDLVAHSHARTDAPPLEVSDTTGTDAEEMDYRRVVLDGEWLWEDRQFLANRVRQSSRGEEIVVPVRPAEGGPAVLVNLGWIPEDSRGDVLRDFQPGEPSGLARDYSSLDGRLIPSGSWTRMSPHDIGEALGYPVTEWVLIAGEELDGPAAIGSALPVQGWERFHNTTPHVEYALTWFGIAAALVAIGVARLVIVPRRAKRTGRADEARPVEA